MITYNPGPGVEPYLADKTNRMVLLTGPIGSGKTTAALFKMVMLKSGWVNPGSDSVRRSRFAVIAPGFGNTVLRTFLDWFPPSKMGGYYQPAEHKAVLRFGDRVVEVLFFDWDGVRRWEYDGAPDLTGAIIDSARIAEWSDVVLVASRIGRYPWGGKAFNYSMDMVSAPCKYREDGSVHWMYERFKMPLSLWDGYAIYELTQAAGVDNLPPGYYDKLSVELSDRKDLLYGEWD